MQLDLQRTQVQQKAQIPHLQSRHRKSRISTFIQVFEKNGGREEDCANFIQSLPAKEPRMCVFDLEYTNKDGMNCSKLFFTYWLPDGTPLKTKLLYATFK